MARMRGSDCAVVCNLVDTHTHTTIDAAHVVVALNRGGGSLVADALDHVRVKRALQKEVYLADSLRLFLLKKKHTHTHTQCEWHRMTRMTGPDCAVMCSLINTHTHTRGKRGRLWWNEEEM